MGDDAPPAFLSRLPRPLWDYCKQRFAQVTNPPIDPLRETHVMSLRVFLGETGVLNSPLLDAGQMKLLKASIPFAASALRLRVADGIRGAKAVLERLRSELPKQNGDKPVPDPSDRSRRRRGARSDSALYALAVTAQISGGCRSVGRPGDRRVRTGARHTHHVALLVAAGASGVFPYLALEQAVALRPDGVARYRLRFGERPAQGDGSHGRLDHGQLSATASCSRSSVSILRFVPKVFEDAGCVLGGKTLDRLLEDCLIRHQARRMRPMQATAGHGSLPFSPAGRAARDLAEIVRRLHRPISRRPMRISSCTATSPPNASP
mgnify:CR=1 FL=1